MEWARVRDQAFTSNADASIASTSSVAGGNTNNMKNWIPWLIVAVLALFIVSDKLFFERRQNERFNAERTKLTKTQDSLRLLNSIDSSIIAFQLEDLTEADEIIRRQDSLMNLADSMYIAELKRLGVYNTTNNHARVKDIILWRNPRATVPAAK
jgi:hypothetical protein